MASRNAVLRGHSVELFATFVDAIGDPTDPTDLKLSLYPPGHDPRLGHPGTDAWVFEATLTSGGTGSEADPLSLVERVSEGKFRYVFTIPEDADIGSAFDRWEGELDLQELDSTFNFVIVGGGSVGITQLEENNIVMIQLSESIAATDGSTLGSDTTYYFTTTYNPLYSSVRRIRLDLGPIAQDIADDTINLAIFEASLNADLYDFISSKVNHEYFVGARREYVSCLAELILIQALSGDLSLSTNMKKSLGNLSVSRGGGTNALAARGDAARKCVEMWRIAITSGGALTPGSSVKPGFSVKGAYAEDAIVVARQWRSTSGIGRSAANHNSYSSGRRDKKTYRSGLHRWWRYED